MKKMNRSTFEDRYLTTITDPDNEFKSIYVLPEYYNSHLLVDSRLHTDHDYNAIKTHLDGLNIQYKELTGHDQCYQDIRHELPMIDRTYHGIYIFNSNFKNADLLQAD